MKILPSPLKLPASSISARVEANIIRCQYTRTRSGCELLQIITRTLKCESAYACSLIPQPARQQFVRTELKRNIRSRCAIRHLRSSRRVCRAHCSQLLRFGIARVRTMKDDVRPVGTRNMSNT